MLKLTKKNLEKHAAYWRPYSTEAKIRDWLHTNPFNQKKLISEYPPYVKYKNLEKHTAHWRPYSTEAKIRDWLHTNPFNQKKLISEYPPYVKYN